MSNHEFDIFPDDLPEGRGQPLPGTVIIEVEFFSSKPNPIDLHHRRLGFVSDGWAAVTSEVLYQAVGYPYRVEYRGVK